MNRSLFTSLILVFSIIFTTDVSLSAGKDKWSFGARGGINFSNIAATGLPSNTSFNSLTRLGFGGVVNYKLDDYMSIRTDVMYLQKGAKFTDAIYPVNNDELKVSDIAIAPFFVYSINGEPTETQIFLQGGLELDLNLSADWNKGNSVIEYENSEWCFNIGTGVKIPFDNGTLIPDIHYSLGLSNIISTRGITAKSNGFQLMFTYLFNEN